MTPLIFFDTEFTDFTNPQLLSLGMVTHDYELLKRSLEDAGHWKHLRQRLRPVDIDDLTGRAEGLQAAAAELAQLRSRRIGLHHALADALALRAAYLAVTQPIGGAR